MLKRHLEAVEVDDDEELSLRHRKLEQRVSQALWRLQLVDHDPRMANYFSRPPQDGCAVVRKAWLARLNPSVQTWYGYSPGRRKLRSPCSSHHQRKSKDRSIDPLLINRLLSDPLSLMATSMMNSQLSAARQVADLYQLWETPGGRELHFSLAHASAVQELQRIGRQVAGIENPEIETNDSALSHVRLPSAVETQLSTLQQAVVPSLTVDDDWQSAVLMADLINSSTLSTPQLDVQLLNFALRKVEGTVDVNVEPWRTLKRLADCSNYHLEHIDCPPGSSPIQSHLPFDLELLQQRASHLEAVRIGYKRLIDAAQLGGCPPDAFDSALEDLNQNLQPLENHSTTPLLRMKRYLHLLRQLTPSRLREGSAAFLLEEHHAGVLIVERLREDPEAIEQIETIARSVGIELPSFLAECLCSIPDSGAKKLVDLSDREFVAKLMNYLHGHSPLLAQVVELQLQTEHGFSLQDSSMGERVNIESMAVFRRYLQRPSKAGQKELATSPPIMIRPPKRPAARPLPDSPSPVVDAHNSLLAESEEEPTARLGALMYDKALILEAIPQTTAIQLEHLLSQPLLMIEQLLMNSQMSVATDLIKVIRLNGPDEDIEEMDTILLRYATKALALGLPEIPSSPPLTKDSSNARQAGETPKRKKNSTFTPPANVPPKDQWVADADVNQCPCCQTIQFSMFDRRHHCRRCGRVVCGACSPHRRLVDGYGDVPVRTCVDCHSTLQDRTSDALSAIRLPSQDGGGQLVWRLSLDAQHNNIARREFSYEHAPNLALALAMVHLCQCNEMMANFLLDQSSSMLATLHRYLVHGTLMDVCSDPLMMFSLIKSLILGAKMRYSDIIAAPGQCKGKPSRGLARCDALLGQIDLLSLLVSANCLHLLPPQPMSQLDTWRKLRDRLIDIELWSLALDVSTKAGLDAGSVWAAWGLVCLKAGNFQGILLFSYVSQLFLIEVIYVIKKKKLLLLGARQRFQRCLKPGKNSPLLQEILSVLESLSIPCASLPGNRNESNSGSSWTSKRTRKLSSPSSLPSPVFNCDNPQLIAASLTRLNDICAGHLVEVEDKNCIMEEILFYLENYGQPESPCAYLVEKSGRIDLAVHRFASSSSSRHQTSDVFNQGLLLPCLKSSKLEDLVIEMKRHDASFHSWKSHLLAAAQLLETKCFWNSLYQLHCLSGDWIRASLVAIRRLYLNDLFSVETLVARSHLLEDVVTHLNQYLARQADLGDQGENDRHLPLWWPENEVVSLQKTIQLQMKVTAFLDGCLKEGKLSSSFLAVVKSVTQSPDGISGPSGDLNSNNSSGVYLIPTLLGSRQFRCSNAVLVACASPDAIAFELSWTICSDLRVRLDRFFRLTSFVLIRRGQVPALIQLVEFIKARMNSQSVGFFDMDELLVECATLVQERDKENRSPDLELIVHHIKKPASKIRGFINLGWLKAAYLLAVKNGQITDVIHIQQEAARLQQTAVLALCDKWLRARNIAK